MTANSAAQEAGFALLTIRRLLVPTAFAGLVSYQALSVLPLIVGGLIDHRGFTASQAGMVGSLEVFAMAGTAIILSPRINRIQRQRHVPATQTRRPFRAGQRTVRRPVRHTARNRGQTTL